MVSQTEARSIIRLYVEEGLSRDKIALILGLPHSRITNALRKSGIKMRPPRTPIIVTELTISNPPPPRIESWENQVVVRHQIRLTRKLAYLLGWIVGDGYSNRREIDAIVSLRERKLIEHPVKALLARFGTILVVPRNGALIIRCLSTELARVLCTATGQRYWRNVDLILEFRRYTASFIAGFWDADGGVFRSQRVLQGSSLQLEPLSARKGSRRPFPSLRDRSHIVQEEGERILTGLEDSPAGRPIRSLCPIRGETIAGPDT